MASKHKCGPAPRGQLNLLPRELALIKLAPSAQEHQAQMANEFGPQCLFRQVLCCNWPNISRYNANIMFFKNLSLVYFLGNKNLHNYSLNMLTHQHYEGNSGLSVHRLQTLKEHTISISLGITSIKQERKTCTYLPEENIATEAVSKCSQIFPAYVSHTTLYFFILYLIIVFFNK